MIIIIIMSCTFVYLLTAVLRVVGSVSPHISSISNFLFSFLPLVKFCHAVKFNFLFARNGV